MPWRDPVAAVLIGYFGGQEFGHAVADVRPGAYQLRIGTSAVDLPLTAKVDLA